MENNPYGMAAMWAQGDWVIKSVALLLLIMSIASWYVIITRSIRLYRLRKNVGAVDKFVKNGGASIRTRRIGSASGGN